MTGLIDVGGGMRDIYGAGVLDCFIDNNITFDVCIGVSAGSATITATVGIYEYTCNVTVTHENETSLGYGVYKIDNCSCGENGYFTTNT